MDSILMSVRKLLGGDGYCEHFDSELIPHINMTLSELSQLGVGPPEGFMIMDTSEQWSNLTTDKVLLGFIKTFVALKVKLIFDPPASSAVIEAMKNQITELTWRISVAVETATTSKPIEPDGEEEKRNGPK